MRTHDAVALLGVIVELAALVGSLRQVELLELLEDCAQGLRKAHLHDSHRLHLLVCLRFFLMGLFLLSWFGLSRALSNWPRFLLDNPEVDFNTLQLLGFALFKLVGQLDGLLHI